MKSVKTKKAIPAIACGDQRCPHIALPPVDKRSINKAGPNDDHA